MVAGRKSNYNPKPVGDGVITESMIFDRKRVVNGRLTDEEVFASLHPRIQTVLMMMISGTRRERIIELCRITPGAYDKLRRSRVYRCASRFLKSVKSVSTGKSRSILIDDMHRLFDETKEVALKGKAPNASLLRVVIDIARFIAELEDWFPDKKKITEMHATHLVMVQKRLEKYSPHVGEITYDPKDDQLTSSELGPINAEFIEADQKDPEPLPEALVEEMEFEAAEKAAKPPEPKKKPHRSKAEIKRLEEKRNAKPRSLFEAGGDEVAEEKAEYVMAREEEEEEEREESHDGADEAEESEEKDEWRERGREDKDARQDEHDSGGELEPDEGHANGDDGGGPEEDPDEDRDPSSPERDSGDGDIASIFGRRTRW